MMKGQSAWLAVYKLPTSEVGDECVTTVPSWPQQIILKGIKSAIFPKYGQY